MPGALPGLGERAGGVQLPSEAVGDSAPKSPFIKSLDGSDCTGNQAGADRERGWAFGGAASGTCKLRGGMDVVRV